MTQKSLAQLPATSSFFSQLASTLKQHTIIGLLLFITAALCFVNQPYYPPIWHDEGIFLHAPQNLLLYGQYATLSSDGLKLFDGHLSGLGPTITLPIAWVFSVWGIGLTQARAVIGLYTVLAVLGLYLLGLELTTRRAALLAALLFLCGFVRDMLWLSRAVMGEVPSLAFLVTGLWAWLRAARRHSSKTVIWLILSGLLFGAAVAAKPQSILLLPVLALMWLLDRAYYRALSHRYFILPILSSAIFPALWYAYQALTLLGTQSSSDIGHVAQMTGLALLGSSLSAIAVNLVTLPIRHYFLIWGPATAYVVLRATERNRDGLRLLLVPLCIILWTSWWALLSIGWSRYAFVPLALATLPTAILAEKVLSSLDLRPRSLHTLKPVDSSAFFVVLILFSALGRGLIGQVYKLQAEATTAPQDFAALVEQVVPETAIIESWEWEIDTLAQRTFHHPPAAVDEAAVLQNKLGQGYDYDYDWQALGSEYLIVGPFAKNFELYEPDIELGCCVLLGEVGDYELYRVIR